MRTEHHRERGYRTGQRDGRLGLDPEVDEDTPNLPDGYLDGYMEGWAEGYRTYKWENS